VKIFQNVTIFICCLLGVGTHARAEFPRAQTVPLHALRNAEARFRPVVTTRGEVSLAREGVVLIKRKAAPGLQALLVPAGSELATMEALRQREDVSYAELDVVLTRQFNVDDPEIGLQWHHKTIRSADAWAISLATHQVTLAILDNPFQMNHPDLASNTLPGWDMVTGRPVLEETRGFYHSTIGAGLAAAVINNLTGGSGVANCWLMPVSIGESPTASDMHEAIVWAADQGVRVVNLSWDGAFSEVINEAGVYLKQKTGGMLFMSGVNGRRALPYPAHPHIYAIAMTDRNDEPRSAYGAHIDFAAPGWEIYSTSENSGYATDSGTSYSTPLAAGMAAWIMSVAPELGPDAIEQILKETAVDLGETGWDSSFGWGRLDFGATARVVYERLPLSRVAADRSGNMLRVRALFSPGASYRLFRAEDARTWRAVAGMQIQVDESTVYLTDPAPPGERAFYKVEITRARP
jgi:thermitase